MILATTISVNGIHGVFLILAAILFLIAAVAAWLAAGRALIWAVLVAVGLCLWVLTGIIH